MSGVRDFGESGPKWKVFIKHLPSRLSDLRERKGSMTVRARDDDDSKGSVFQTQQSWSMNLRDVAAHTGPAAGPRQMEPRTEGNGNTGSSPNQEAICNGYPPMVGKPVFYNESIHHTSGQGPTRSSWPTQKELDCGPFVSFLLCFDLFFSYWSCLFCGGVVVFLILFLFLKEEK